MLKRVAGRDCTDPGRKPKPTCPANDGQILISRRVAVAVEEDAKLEEIGEVSLKGLSQAVAVYNVVQ